MSFIQKIRKKHLTKELSRFFHLDVKFFLTGGFWLALAQALVVLFAILGASVLARMFTEEQFGEYQFIIALVGILALFTMPGFNVATLQSIIKGHNRTVLYAIQMRFLFSFLGSAALVLVSLYFHFIRAKQTWWLYLILAALFPFLGSGEPLLLPALAKENFRKLFLRMSVVNVIPTLVVAVSAALTQSLPISILSFFAAQILVYACLLVKDYKQLIQGTVDKKAKHFGIHLSILNLVNYIQGYYDKLAITYLFGFAQIAVYAIASAIADQLYALSKMLATLIYPRLIRREKGTTFQAVKQRIPHLFLLFTLIGIIGILIAPFFIVLVYTKKYHEAILLSQVFLGINVVRSVSYLLFRTLEAHKQTRQLYVANVSYFLIEVLGMVLFLPRYGLWGALMAQAISNTWHFGICLFFISRRNKPS